MHIADIRRAIASLIENQPQHSPDLPIDSTYEARCTKEEATSDSPIAKELLLAPAHELQQKLESSALSSVQIVEAYLAQIERHNTNVERFALSYLSALGISLWLKHGGATTNASKARSEVFYTAC
jgi:hypothetical protein